MDPNEVCVVTQNITVSCTYAQNITTCQDISFALLYMFFFSASYLRYTKIDSAQLTGHTA